MSAGVHQRRAVPLRAIGALSVPCFNRRKKVARLTPSVFQATESGIALGGRDTFTYGILFSLGYDTEI
jgi:hypothetical protein